jgi:hypothetical protein
MSQFAGLSVRTLCPLCLRGESILRKHSPQRTQSSHSDYSNQDTTDSNAINEPISPLVDDNGGQLANPLRSVAIARWLMDDRFRKQASDRANGDDWN